VTWPVLLDTGPLIAVLDRRDARHHWACEQFDSFDAPFLTCEAVLTEACFLAKRILRGIDAVLDTLARGTVVLDFSARSEIPALASLLHRYSNVPMSLADACLVRMTELRQDARLLTLDRDFLIYRRHDREPIPAILPPV
jgi:predicted nucleic acid-binding protein